jgi:hypothetical protein
MLPTLGLGCDRAARQAPFKTRGSQAPQIVSDPLRSYPATDGWMIPGACKGERL